MSACFASDAGWRITIFLALLWLHSSVSYLSCFTTLLTSLALHLLILALVKQYSSTGGVKSNPSPSTCAALSRKMDAICSLTLCCTKPPNLIIPTVCPISSLQYWPYPPLLSPPSILTKVHTDIGSVHGWRMGWKLCILLSTVCFSGNRSDNRSLPEGHLTVTLQANTYKSNQNEMKWFGLDGCIHGLAGLLKKCVNSWCLTATIKDKGM